MKIERHRSPAVGVGKLMYVGDAACDYNHNALTLCHAGAAVAVVALLLGKPTVAKLGAGVAVAGFLAL